MYTSFLGGRIAVRVSNKYLYDISMLYETQINVPDSSHSRFNDPDSHSAGVNDACQGGFLGGLCWLSGQSLYLW